MSLVKPVLTIGGVALREGLNVEQTGEGRLSISGQESAPPSPKALVRSVHRNLLALRGQVVPVVFESQDQHSGFYFVSGVNSKLMEFAGRTLTATWSLELDAVGFGTDVEFETRLPMIARVDDLTGTQVASFWHAPPPASTGYLTGATVPAGTVDRVGADGTVRAYLGLPAGSVSRWTSTAAGHLVGAARVLLDGYRHLGPLTPLHTSWEVSNELVRITPDAGRIAVQVWRGAGGWSTAKKYAATVSGTSQVAAPEFTLLRNDPEEVRVRLTYPVLSAGRLTVDLSLRRGARFVTGIIKRHSAATLGITRTADEAATLFTGGAVATAADGEGVRFVMGSSKTPSSTTTATASFTKATTTALDFFLGATIEPVAAGDAHTDLLLQYLGTTGDTTRVMPR